MENADDNTMEYVIAWIVFALLVGVFSHRKGNGFWNGFLLSLLLSPLVGFVIALSQNPDVKRQEQLAMQSGHQKKCPSCAEMVKVDALVCRFCQHKFSQSAAAPPGTL